VGLRLDAEEEFNGADLTAFQDQLVSCRPGIRRLPARGYADIVPYVTLDGSEIRELMHPDRHRVRQLWPRPWSIHREDFRRQRRMSGSFEVAEGERWSRHAPPHRKRR
jgi:hypothetical protein